MARNPSAKTGGGPKADEAVHRRDDPAPAVGVGSEEKGGSGEPAVDSATIADGEATRGGYG